MITYVKTNIFETPAQVIVNAVNTVGVMGKGIAKNYKDIYPEMFVEYRSLCENKLLEIGKLWIYKTPNKWILNFPTKKHWRNPSKLEYIELGLKKFVDTYEEKGIRSISFPLLGCGNGGLDWVTQVQPLMERYLKDLPIDVFIHLSDRNNGPKKEHLDIEETKLWLRSEPSYLSFSEIWDDIQEVINSEENFGIRSNQKYYRISIGIESNEPTIKFASDDQNYVVTYDQLLDLWKYLRSVGFVMKTVLPSGLHEIGAPLLNLLNKLSYIEPVEMGRKYNDESDLEMGIRLIPYKVNGTNTIEGRTEFE